MRISMWMIAEKLEKYQPECTISDGGCHITGVRFFSTVDDITSDLQYVYLRLNYPTVELVNGGDRILIQGKNANDVLNDLLVLFDFYHNWETSLRDAASRKAFQEIIDLGHKVLGNPMMLSGVDGNVLGISSAFANDDVNDYWREARATRRIPAFFLAVPTLHPDGTPAQWTSSPEFYILGDGTKTIGTHIEVNGKVMAGFAIWQYRRTFLPSDIGLMQALCDAIASAIDTPDKAAPMRHNAAVLRDLLNKNPTDDSSLQFFREYLKPPYQLMLIQSPVRDDNVYPQILENHFTRAKSPCVPLHYDDYLVVLVSYGDAHSFVQSVLNPLNEQYYVIGLSLPFHDLHNCSGRYAQTLFVLRQANEKPGIYNAEDYTLQYLLSQRQSHIKEAELIHPALSRLKQYDAEKKGELYETLHQYLLNERSVIQSAQALGIHKNSMIYRLQRIQSIIDIDMEDPEKRTYLLLSYLLDK